MTDKEEGKDKPQQLPRGLAFDGRNIKTPAAGDVNAGRVPKTPPKPTGSGSKEKK
jgi:hypothetical protein